MCNFYGASYNLDMIGFVRGCAFWGTSCSYFLLKKKMEIHFFVQRDLISFNKVFSFYIFYLNFFIHFKAIEFVT